MDLQGQYKFDQNKAFPSVGSRIAAAIAIGLGEAARGFRGGQGQNIGLTLVNQSIEREIERQLGRGIGISASVGLSMGEGAGINMRTRMGTNARREHLQASEEAQRRDQYRKQA